MLDAVRELGSLLSRFTERWVPDSWVICMILTSIALVLAIGGAGAGVEEAVLAWGDGVWVLLTLAMQFTIAMVAAHACVSSRPVFRLLDGLAGLPNPEKPVQAILLAGVFSLVTAYINWALCLVACALFVPFVCRRNPQVDVRVLIAASYIGLGAVGLGRLWRLHHQPDPALLRDPHPGGDPHVLRRRGRLHFPDRRRLLRRLRRGHAADSRPALRGPERYPPAGASRGSSPSCRPPRGSPRCAS